MGFKAAYLALVYLGKRLAGPVMRFLLFAIIAVHIAEVAALPLVDGRILKQAAVNTMTASILIFLLIVFLAWL